MLREQKGSVSQPEACLKSARCDFDASVGGQISIGGSATLTGDRVVPPATVVFNIAADLLWVGSIGFVIFKLVRLAIA